MILLLPCGITPTEPGYVSPFSKHFTRKLIFLLVTFSGNVNFFAIYIGIPISSKSIIGSGVITLLADISTRDDIKLALILPNLGIFPLIL